MRSTLKYASYVNTLVRESNLMDLSSAQENFRVTVGELYHDLAIESALISGKNATSERHPRDRKDATLDAASDKWAPWRFRAKRCSM